MTELLTAAQMRAIEQAAIDSGQVTGLELMERAGRGAVDAILAEWPELAEGPHRAVVLCGPGNNGGDGFVVARLLKERGWEVEVSLYGSQPNLSGSVVALAPDARRSQRRWNGPLRLFQDGRPSLSAETLFVDALFGIGQTRPLPQGIAEWLEHHDMDAPRRVVALDITSGISSDSGKALYPCLNGLLADLTVTFHRAKLGHFLAEGAEAAGILRIADIGLDFVLSAPMGVDDTLNGLAETLSRRPEVLYGISPKNFALLAYSGFLDRRVELRTVNPEGVLKAPWRGSHKFDHGHALILSGGVGRGGAARMAARGALRIGAGLVTVGCPPAAVIENAARLDAIMLRPVKDADALREVLEDERLNALCLGPGLGLGEREAALIAAALGVGRPGRDPGPRAAGDDAERTRLPADRGPGSGAGTARGIVLDGDALTLIGRDPALFGALHDRCVLTPHMGEFARVFPDIAEKLDAPATEAPAYSKVDAARDAAERAGCTVLLKGPDTVIADPDGRAAINSAHYERSVPWLATAGAGDVLAGFIAGLLARGLSPFDAACAAAWLHVECALEFGPGLIAEDLPEMLPRVLARLEKEG